MKSGGRGRRGVISVCLAPPIDLVLDALGEEEGGLQDIPVSQLTRPYLGAAWLCSICSTLLVML